MGRAKKYAGSTTSSSNSGMGDSSDLQSWNEVPSIAHFCSLFRQAFDLLEFDIQELEESLLLMNSEDDNTQLVQRLVIKLLRGCSKTFTNNINEDNFNTYLRRLFLSKREDAEEDSLEFNFDCKALLDDDIDYQDLDLRNRVRILHQLCEFRLDAEDVFEKLKNLDASSLRVDPLGKDSEGTTFWYFYGTRLYKEESPKGDDKKKRKDKHKKKKKKDKKKNKKKKRGEAHSASSGDEADDAPNQPRWSVACLTLKDWEDLTAKYKSSKKKAEKELYETLAESFLPEIVKMFAEKEREERRRLLMNMPKRTSNRLERKKQDQEERDRILALKREEERRLEEAYDEKLRQEREKREQEAREERVRAREEARNQVQVDRAKRAQERAERLFDRLTGGLNDGDSDGDDEEADEPTEVQDVEALGSRRSKNKTKQRKKDKSYQPVKSDTDEENNDSKDDSSVYNSDDDLGGSGGLASSSSNKRQRRRKRSKSERSRGSSGAGGGARTNFTNALLRVGTKSTKDSTLDKPVRKSPGLLLETAGRSLLQKATTKSSSSGSSLLSRGSGGGGSSILSSGATVGGLSFGLASSKISFGLYGGHLSVDHGSYAKGDGDEDSNSAEENDVSSKAEGGGGGGDPVGGSSKSSSSSKASSSSVQRQKVFSNWGGEFFKKNLDYRANTNKILEKMNLKSNGAEAPAGGSGSGGSSSSGGLRSLLKNADVTSGTSKRSLDSSSSGLSSAKKLKTSFLNSYS